MMKDLEEREQVINIAEVEYEECQISELPVFITATKLSCKATFTLPVFIEYQSTNTVHSLLFQLSWYRIHLQCRRPWFNSWVVKISWRRDRLPTTVFLCFPGVSIGKVSPAMWETWVRSLGWEDPLEKGMATHSSILAWRIPWIYSPWDCKESDMTE